MDFDQTVISRHSTRDFDGIPVPDEDLRAIVGLAGRTPSSGDEQPWRVYAVSGEPLERIRAAHERVVAAGTHGTSDFPNLHREQWGPQARENLTALNAADVRFLGTPGTDGHGTTDAHGHPADPAVIHETNARLFNVGTVVYLTIQKNITDWNILDLGAFGQTLTLAATARGYDTIIAHEFVRYPQTVRPVAGIPDDEVLAIGIGIGHGTDAKINALKSPRMPLDRYLAIRH